MISHIYRLALQQFINWFSQVKNLIKIKIISINFVFFFDYDLVAGFFCIENLVVATTAKFPTTRYSNAPVCPQSGTTTTSFSARKMCLYNRCNNGMAHFFLKIFNSKLHSDPWFQTKMMNPTATAETHCRSDLLIWALKESTKDLVTLECTCGVLCSPCITVLAWSILLKMFY